MALIVNDRVRESTTVTGTGTATLLGAIAGYQAFSVIGNGNTCYYTISDQLGANWEVGIGTYTLSGTTLARTTVLKSSNANNLVSFTAGTKDVFVTYPAETSVSGGGGGTYPTIQPTLNLDFANTKLLDPRITFVRNSTAAYYDGQTTAMAEQNLLLYSQDFSNAFWNKVWATATSGITAPDGTNSSQKVSGVTDISSVGIRHTVYSAGFSLIGAYTISVYVKAAEYYLFQICDVGGGNFNANFNITSVTATSIYNCTPSITPVGNGWYRCMITTTHAGNIYVGMQGYPLGAASVNSGNQYTGDDTSGIYIWGAQLEQRSSATAYTPTTTAAITNYIPQLMTAPAGVARFDCDPITGKSLGLLIEESRTNLATYSQILATSPYGAYGVATINGTTIAPDGTNNALSLTIPSAGNGWSGGASTTVASTAYTTSWYVKALIGTQIQLLMRYFNTGVSTGSSTTTFTISSGQSVGNGWYRLSFTETTPALTNQTQISWLASASGNSWDIWGAQLEAGAFATSYIPTVASTVTRAADQASITGTNFSSWYNQSQGTVCVNYDFNATSGISANTGIFALNNNNTGNPLNRLDIRYTSSNNTSNGVGLNSPSVGTMLTGGNLNKIASSYSVASSVYVLNSSSISSYSLATMPNPMTQLVIGVTGTVDAPLNGHTRKLSYYPVALSSSNLVALTS